MGLFGGALSLRMNFAAINICDGVLHFSILTGGEDIFKQYGLWVERKFFGYFKFIYIVLYYILRCMVLADAFFFAIPLSTIGACILQLILCAVILFVPFKIRNNMIKSNES